jgi:glutamyl-tRNA reductase
METVQAGGRQETLKRLRALGDSTRDELLARARQQLTVGRDPHEVLQFLANTLTNRLLHPPTAALREAALTGDTELARAAERLFPAKAPYSHPHSPSLPPLPDDSEPAP